MKKQHGKKIVLSSILALSLLLNCFATAATSTPEDPITTEQASPIVSEDISKRGEFEKHFLCEDGSYVAVNYPTPVHEQAENGEWVEIDNTLTAQQDQIKNNSAAFGASFAQTAAPEHKAAEPSPEKTKAAVSNASDEDKLVRLNSEGKELSWSLTGKSFLPLQESEQRGLKAATGISVLEPKAADPAPGFIGPMPLYQVQEHTLSALSEAVIQTEQAELSAAQTVEEANYEKAIVKTAVSSVFYEDALGTGADLQYTVAPYRIKEDIILREKTSFRGYTMHLDTDGLTAVKTEQNSVEFRDEENHPVFTIETPYMYDAAEETSADISIDLVQEGDKATITFTPDPDWLNAPERVYPITIDPAVSSKDKSNLEDTFVHEGNGSCCSGITPSKHDRMYIGKRGNKIHRAYFKIKNLPNIPKGSRVYLGELYVLCTNGTTTSKSFSINKVNSSWNVSSLGWSPQPASTDLQHNRNRNTSNNVVFFNVIGDTLNRMYNGNMVNNGFMIHYTNENDNDYNAVYTSESSNTAGRPYLSVSYNAPANIAAGTYFIRNKYTGKYLDAPNWGGKNTQLNQFSFNGGTNQQWNISKVSSNGLYVFKPVFDTSLSIDVRANVDANDVSVQLYPFGNGPAQQWYIIPNGDGSYRFLSRTSNSYRAMVVEGASTASGAKIIQYTYGGDQTNDEWYLEQTSTIREDLKYSQTISLQGEKDIFLCNTDSTNTYRYTVETFGNTDTYLDVRVGNALYTDDDSGESLNAAIGFTANPYTNIVIRVGAYGTNTGSYSLQIRKQKFNIIASSEFSEDAIIPENRMGLLNYKINKYINPSTFTEVNSELFMFSGHGVAVIKSDGTKEVGGIIRYSDSPKRDINGNDLQKLNMSNCKIAIWSACYSASSGNNSISIAEAGYKAGAKASLGWYPSVDISMANYYTNSVFNALYEGKTLNEAIYITDSAIIDPTDPVLQHHLWGDGNQSIASPTVTKSAVPVYNDNALALRFAQEQEVFSYTAFELGGGYGTRYYKTINNILTNDYYDSLADGSIISRSATTISEEEAQSLLPITIRQDNIALSKTIIFENDMYTLKETKEHYYYYKQDDEILPLKIIYATYANQYGNAILETNCFNVKDGSELDYNSLFIK